MNSTVDVYVDEEIRADELKKKLQVKQDHAAKTRSTITAIRGGRARHFNAQSDMVQ